MLGEITSESADGAAKISHLKPVGKIAVVMIAAKHIIVERENKMIGYLAIDQYGQTYQIGNNSPRKWLLEHFGRKHCEKMYIDLKSGGAKHIGYIIAGMWLRILTVGEWERGRLKNG